MKQLPIVLTTLLLCGCLTQPGPSAHARNWCATTPPAYDEHLVTPLNDWDVLTVPPETTGWRQTLQALVWSFVGPVLERQQSSNPLLVHHLNRNITIGALPRPPRGHRRS